MPFKDPERRRAYARVYERERKARERRARGAMPIDAPDSIKNVQPWREYGLSRVSWYRLFRWTPKERERWKHRERANG
jgi:hypothetical protein